MLWFIESILKFCNFLDTDILHFLIILLQCLKISLFSSHFSPIVLLKIFALFYDKSLFCLILFFICFYLFINFFLQYFIFVEKLLFFFVKILSCLFLFPSSCKILLSKRFMSFLKIFILSCKLVDNLSFFV